SRPSRRLTASRLTSGNASHTGAVASTGRLKGARQHLQTPLTSDVRLGLHLTQPPDIRGHRQQAVDSYDRRIPSARFTYVCSLACSLSTPSAPSRALPASPLRRSGAPEQADR